MDDSCGGERTPESRRYSSSVRMVLRERLIPALSPISERCKEMKCFGRVDVFNGELYGDCRRR